MSDSENAGNDQTEGVVLAVHLHDEETADAFKRLFEYHPDASMWAYDEYRTCDGCGEVRRIVQGGCCRECMEETLRADGGTSGSEREPGFGDYLEGLPHEVVNEFDAGRGLSMRRVALDAEDAYTVDIVLAERHLRLVVETSGTEASELTWDGRTTFHDPDAVETFAEELLHAADWMREQGGVDG